MINAVKTTFTPQELGLIQDYAKGYLKEREVENISFFTLDNFLRLPVIGSVFGSNQKDKVDEKRKNYGLGFAIAALATSIFYVLSTIPKSYALAKEVYLTWKIKKLSNKNTSDYREKIIIENLKDLIKADKSARHFTTQKIRTFAGFSFFVSTATWFASYSYKITEDTLGFTKKLAPEYLTNFVKKSIPEKIKPSDQTLNKVTELLSNDNLIYFTKCITAASFGLLAANKMYNLYKDFFYDTEHSKSFLVRKSEVIQKTANELMLEDEKRKEIEMMQKMNQKQTNTVSTFNGLKLII